MNALPVVLVGGAITLALRTVPFALVRPLRRSALVRELAATMPGGILVVLALSLLRGAHLSGAGQAAPTLGCLALTVGVWWWRRSVALAVVAGTVAYMTVVNLV